MAMRSSGRRWLCKEHPHHPAVDRCDVCLRYFCEACLVRGGARLRCLGCAAGERAAVVRGAGHRRWPVNGAAVAIVPLAALLTALVLLKVGAAEGFRGFGGSAFSQDARAASERAATAQEVLKENEEFGFELLRKQCLRTPARGCDALLNPPQPVRAGPETIAPLQAVAPASPGTAARFPAQNLHNNAGPTTPGWRSPDETLPQELLFDLGAVRQIDRVAFRQTQASPPPSWAQDVELLLSTTAEQADFRTVGRWHLMQTTAPQEFGFPRREARYAKLRIVGRFGDSDFSALGAFVLGIATGDPGPLLSP